MLILTRRVGETLMIGDAVSVTVLGLRLPEEHFPVFVMLRSLTRSHLAVILRDRGS